MRCDVCGSEFNGKGGAKQCPQCREKEKLKICPECGRLFVSNKHNQKWCSKECRNKGKNRKSNYKKPLFSRKCKGCGKIFTTTILRKAYCNRKCYAKHNKIDLYIIPKEKESDRPMSEEERMHIHNWYKGGDSIKQIAEDLKRSPDKIRKALKIPLSEAQEKIIKEHPYQSPVRR